MAVRKRPAPEQPGLFGEEAPGAPPGGQQTPGVILVRLAEFPTHPRLRCTSLGRLPEDPQRERVRVLDGPLKGREFVVVWRSPSPDAPEVPPTEDAPF